jgi:hypothetical protein
VIAFGAFDMLVGAALSRNLAQVRNGTSCEACGDSDQTSSSPASMHAEILIIGPLHFPGVLYLVWGSKEPDGFAEE